MFCVFRKRKWWLTSRMHINIFSSFLRKFSLLDGFRNKFGCEYDQVSYQQVSYKKICSVVAALLWLLLITSQLFYYHIPAFWFSHNRFLIKIYKRNLLRFTTFLRASLFALRCLCFFHYCNYCYTYYSYYLSWFSVTSRYD